VNLAWLTHAAGLSSTGDPTLDALLPMPERFEIPEETAQAIRSTRATGGRVIAVGTTVTRALEGSAAQHDGVVQAGAGTTDLVIGAGFRLRVVDGILSGMHEPEASHFRLLEAFAPREILAQAHAHAEASGYLGHEFGDSSLILSEAA
jgi:S-adenosylmethionine:tRNA ribosyltransferase-isomerase